MLNIEMMNELMTNEEFAQKIGEAGSMENAYRLFVEAGVEGTWEEFNAYIEETRQDMISKGLIGEDGELSVELLETVSGGKWYNSLALFALAGLAVYAGQPGAAVLLIIAGIAVWKN